MDVNFSTSFSPQVFYADISDVVETTVEKIRENVKLTRECHDPEEIEVELNTKYEKFHNNSNKCER